MQLLMIALLLLAGMSLFIVAVVLTSLLIAHQNSKTVARVFRARGRSERDIPDAEGMLPKDVHPAGFLHGHGVNVFGQEVVSVNGIKLLKPKRVIAVNAVNPDLLS